MVDRVYGTPARWAERATATSPEWCIIRVNPVGENTYGRSIRVPSIVVDVSTLDTSCSTEGWNVRSRSTRRARRIETSDSADPST